MSRWWRAYDEAVDDPKLQTLPAATAWGWFNLMCLASANDGVLPSTEHIAFKLRVSPAKAETLVETLQVAGLIDMTDEGLKPHNWAARQFKSDVSTSRVKQHRERKRGVAGNESETFHPPFQKRPQRQSTETETEREKEEVSGALACATRPDIAQAFSEFWKAYPSRGAGGNPKRPALKLFEAAVRRGANPAEIVAAVRAGVGFDPQKVGTEFIPQAVKWLRDCRYEDAPPPAAEQAQHRASTDAHVYVRQSESMWDLLEARWRSEKGKSPPTDRDGGWFFPRAWVPVHEGATC